MASLNQQHESLTLTERKRVIATHPVFSELSDSELTSIAIITKEIQIKAGTTIVNENDMVDSIDFIVHGYAEARHLYQVDGKIEIVPIAALGIGETIGLNEVGFYSNTGKRTATVVAVTDMTLLQCDILTLNTAIEKIPRIGEVMRAQIKTLQRINLIKTSIPFAKLGTDNFIWLISKIDEIAINADTNLFHKGDQGDYCYLILSGTIEIYLPQANNTELHLGTLTAPAVFGETAVFLNATRNASARAVNDCHLLRIKREVLLEVTSTEPQVAAALKELIRARYRPKHFDHIEYHSRQNKLGETLITLKDPINHHYFRLAPEGWFIWQLLDGKHSLRDIALAFYHEYGLFDTHMISSFIIDLMNAGFIETSKAMLADEKKALPVWLQALMRLRRITEYQYAFRDCDGWITKTYQRFFYLFFTRALQIPLAILAIIGVCTFVYHFHRYVELLRSEANICLLLFAAIVATIATSIPHELAHAYTTKAFGRKVNTLGIGWFWLGPVAYCDTSDMWLNSRWDRVKVDLAGLYVNCLCAGSAAIIAIFTTNTSVTIFFWLFALLTYLIVFTNLNPQIELDGYYTLMDLSGKDNLREAALRWLIDTFPNSWRKQTILQHKIEAMYFFICCIYFILSIVITFIIVSNLLYGLMNISNPYLSATVTLFFIALSSVGMVSESLQKR